MSSLYEKYGARKEQTSTLALSMDPTRQAQQLARFRERYPTKESLFPEADSYILVGGCSMTAGAEMEDWAGDFEYLQCEFSDSSWPQRIREARHPDKIVFNSSQSGASNQHIARRMLYWLRKSRPTAVYVMWTSIQRVHFRNHKVMVGKNSRINANPSGNYCDAIWYPSTTAGMLLGAEHPENKGKLTAGHMRKNMIEATGGELEYKNVLNLFETLEDYHLRLKFLHDDLYWRDYLRQYCKAEGIPLYETSAWEHKGAWEPSWRHHYYEEKGKMDPYIDMMMHNEYKHTEKVFNVDHDGKRIGFVEWWDNKNGECHPGSHPVAQAHTEWAEEWCKWLEKV